MDRSEATVSELRVALTVEDVDAALRFFGEALGLPEVADWSSAEGRCVVLSAGRATIEILDGGHAAYVDDVEVGRRLSGTVRLAVEVPDSRAAVDRLRDAGARCLPRCGPRRGETTTGGCWRRPGCS